MRGGDQGNVRTGRLLKGVKAVAAAVAMFVAGGASAQQLFDFPSDPITGPVVPPNYTPAPFLKEIPNNAGTVSSYLAGQPVKAVKVYQDLSPATVNAVYGPNNVKYTFADYEGPTYLARIAVLANQIKSSAGTGPSAQANQSYIGNFEVAPFVNDTSRPASTPGTTFAQYLSSGANMANEALYPGSSSFKNPELVGSGSLSPNIRSALFTGPITRASLVSNVLPAGHAHIPYVTRFNNVVGGIANGTADNGGGPQPAFYFDDAHGTAGQLISRGDFSAMIAHYRARGVNGVHTLDGGVVGYSQSDFNADAAAGFHFAPFETIFNNGGAKVATLDTVVKTDGAVKSLEQAGVVASGVYSLTQAGGLGKLALLVSNLDDSSHDISFPNKIGGKIVPGTIQILAGQHKLLDFTGAGTSWTLLNPGGTRVFIDDNRDGVGVPEPTMIGGLALVLCVGFGRRKRRTA